MGVVSELTDSGAGPRWFFASLAEVKLTRQASGDQMSIVEITAPPGDMPPLHVHRTDDEAWVVLEGEVSFFAGSNEPVRVAAGGAAFGPKGVAHTYAWNRTVLRGCSRFAYQASSRPL